MNAQIPKSWEQLPPKEKKRITDYYNTLYNNDIALVLDTYIKMACIILHDGFHLTENELIQFIASHRMAFRMNYKWVKEKTQDERLNKRLKEIFTTYGYPKAAFDDITGRLNPND